MPLLFLTFQSGYGIPLSRITVLVTINFGLQLLEVLVGPVVEAYPSEHKEQAMSLLHSFCALSAHSTDQANRFHSKTSIVLICLFIIPQAQRPRQKA